jgi:hypothetical protein
LSSPPRSTWKPSLGSQPWKRAIARRTAQTSRSPGNVCDTTHINSAAGNRNAIFCTQCPLNSSLPDGAATQFRGGARSITAARRQPGKRCLENVVELNDPRVNVVGKRCRAKWPRVNVVGKRYQVIRRPLVTGGAGNARRGTSSAAVPYHMAGCDEARQAKPQATTFPVPRMPDTGP